MKFTGRRGFAFFEERRARKRVLRAQRGFTLIELMLSMMIFGIAVVSVISIQNTSLQSHINDEDTIIANGLVDQFVEMVQTDAIRWIKPGDLGKTVFLNNTSLRRMSSVGNPVWIPYTDKPVNHQVADITQPNQVGNKARFCIFYLYRWAGEDSTAGVLRDRLIELNVAVLWPRKIGGLSGQDARFFATCGSNNRSLLFTYLEDPKQVDRVNRSFRQVRRVTYIRRDQLGKGT